MDNFISVIIVSERSSNQLCNLVKGILESKYNKDKFEIIIVRDTKAENINCKEILSKENVKIINKKFEGMSVARNIGVKYVSNKSKIIAFIDDDALPLGKWLSNINHFFKNNKDKEILAGRVISKKNESIVSKYTEIFSSHDVNKYGLPIGTNMAFKTKIMKNIPHDERFKKGYDDFDYATSLIFQGKKIGYPKNVKVKHSNPTRFKEILIKKFNSAKYSILFFNKYKQNPFGLRDILILTILLSLLISNIFARVVLLTFSIVLLLKIFLKKTNIKINYLKKIIIFLFFILASITRLFGKIYGLFIWGGTKCERS